MAQSALHAVYRAQVSRTLERDPDAAVEIAQEMIRVFPTDSTAKRKMDDVLFGLLKKRIGDLTTCRRRLGTSRILDHFRQTVAKMSTNGGTDACRRLLGAANSSTAARLLPAPRTRAGWRFRD